MSHTGGRWFVGALVVASALGACSAERPQPPKPKNALHEVDLRELPPESMPPGLLGDQRPNLRHVLADIDDLAKDADSKGLFVRLATLGGRWGVRHDLAQALEVYRATGKPVHCHFADLDNAGYALAAQACDRVSMTPAGTLNLVGVGMQVTHAKELLESMGVRAELLQIGRFKGAAEPFTRDSMSQPLAQSLNALLDDLDAQFRAALAHRESKGDPIADGPYSPREALKKGLIDGVEYDDAARSTAREAAAATNHVLLHAPKKPEPLDFGKVWDALTSDGRREQPQGDRLGYVVLTGEIVSGRDPALDRIVSDPTIEALRDLADKKEVKAVVVRIDSPGGSALASDRIWHALRRVAARKPVAVSVANMAASGGYYIASAGTRIFAAPGSLVGSIGVVGGKISVKDLTDRYGVHTDTLTRGPHSTWLSPLTPFSETERAELRDLLSRTYRLFVHRVSLGRDVEIAKLEPYAQGRLMTGKAALKGQLVDELGSLQEAFVWARQQTQLPDDAPIEVWPGEADMLRALTSMLQRAQAPLDATAIRRAIVAAHSSTLPAWVGALSDGEPAAAALPLRISVR